MQRCPPKLIPLLARSTPYALCITRTRDPSANHPQIFDRLKTRFASRATYSVDYRTYHLKQLGYMLKDNQQQIYDALKTDLDKGSWACDIEEVSCPYFVAAELVTPASLGERVAKGRADAFSCTPFTTRSSWRSASCPSG